MANNKFVNLDFGAFGGNGFPITRYSQQCSSLGGWLAEWFWHRAQIIVCRVRHVAISVLICLDFLGWFSYRTLPHGNMSLLIWYFIFAEMVNGVPGPPYWNVIIKGRRWQIYLPELGPSSRYEVVPIRLKNTFSKQSFWQVYLFKDDWGFWRKIQKMHFSPENCWIGKLMVASESAHRELSNEWSVSMFRHS
jgi:hypothetical protein